LKLTPSVKKVKLLQIYFSNEEGIRKLACLKPIAELTNKREARNTSMEDALKDHLRLIDSFERFLEA